MSDRIQQLRDEAGGDKFSIGEVAAADGCAEITVRRAIEAGELVAHKRGRVFIYKADAVSWLRGRKLRKSTE
jgi:hypothetical protein